MSVNNFKSDKRHSIGFIPANDVKVTEVEKERYIAICHDCGGTSFKVLHSFGLACKTCGLIGMPICFPAAFDEKAMRVYCEEQSVEEIQKKLK